MTLGTAASNSMRKASVSEIRGGASSARKMAAPTPNGTARSKATTEVTTVPKMKGSAPNCLEDRIPSLVTKKLPAELVPRQSGVPIQLENKPGR